MVFHEILNKIQFGDCRLILKLKRNVQKGFWINLVTLKNSVNFRLKYHNSLNEPEDQSDHCVPNKF